MSDELPPLPRPASESASPMDNAAAYGYTAKQMRSYAALARSQAIEAAAQCAVAQWMIDGRISAKECAAAIRALAQLPPNSCAK